jgi:hypothetical protein
LLAPCEVHGGEPGGDLAGEGVDALFEFGLADALALGVPGDLLEFGDAAGDRSPACFEVTQ